MTLAVRKLLDDIDRLAEDERLELTAEILRRTSQIEFSPLDDESLTRAAEDLFLNLDARETADAESDSQ